MTTIEELHQRSGVSHEYIRSRYRAIQSIIDVDTLLQMCGIHYHAPHDFARSGLTRASIDITYSNLVLEHVRVSGIRDIHLEVFRVLKNSGVCWHNVDCTDHYSHNDHSISSINFLKYGTKRWEILGQNDFVYQNRMRINQYFEIFQELGFDIAYEFRYISEEIRDAVETGFPIHKNFVNSSMDDIATTAFRVVLIKRLASHERAQEVSDRVNSPARESLIKLSAYSGLSKMGGIAKD